MSDPLAALLHDMRLYAVHLSFCEYVPVYPDAPASCTCGFDAVLERYDTMAGGFPLVQPAAPAERLDVERYDRRFTGVQIDPDLNLIRDPQAKPLRGKSHSTWCRDSRKPAAPAEGLRKAAQAYIDAVDADMHRPGTPADAERRDDTLAALRAALEGDDR